MAEGESEMILLIVVCFKACLYTSYIFTILDSCRIDFFVDMEVHEDFLMNPASTGTHLIFRFMCDRK